jgi:hypothetical protein
MLVDPQKGLDLDQYSLLCVKLDDRYQAAQALTSIPCSGGNMLRRGLGRRFLGKIEMEELAIGGYNFITRTLRK